MPKAHSTPHKRIKELAQAIEGLGVDILQQIVGRGVVKHGLELVNTVDRVYYYELREPEQNISHLDLNGVLHASQVMVQQLVEKGMLKGNIPKLDNFNGNPQKFLMKFLFTCGRNM